MTRTALRRSLWIGLLMIVALAAITRSLCAATADELDDFLAKIQDAKGDVRRAAWENAGTMGADAVAPLGKLLAGENRAAAKAAERALEVIAHHASRPGADAERKAVSAALTELTKKGNPVKVRDKALRLLGYAGQDDSVPAIAACLGDSEVWEAARWALERIPGEAAARALIEALNYAPTWEEPEVLKFQEAMISTLGAKEAAEAAVPLAKFLRSNDQSIRIATTDALGRIGDPRAAPLLLNIARTRFGREKAIALDNHLRIADRLAENGLFEGALRMYRDVLGGFKDEAPRAATVVGIGKLPLDAALRTLLRALSDPSPMIRDAAINSLTTIEGRDVDGAIAAAIWGAKPDLKTALMRILVDRKSPVADNVLARLLEDRNTDVRLTALELIGKLAEWRKPAIAVQMKFARQLMRTAVEGGPEGKKAALRSYLQIADALLSQGSEGAARAMYRTALTLATEDAERRTALQGLAAIASETSLDIVTKLMENPTLRDDASRAYIAIASKIAVRPAPGAKERGIRMLMGVVESPCSVDVIQLAASKLKEFGVVIPIAERSGFVTRWWLIGPFPNPGNSAWEKEFPPERDVDLGQALQSDGRTLRWKEVSTDNLQGRVNLEDHFRPNQNVAAYAYTEINVPKAMRVKFKIGSDDSVVCWLNGKPIHAVKVSRGLTVDQDVVNTTLQAGSNTILMKVLNEGAQWEFCLRITDPQNKPIDVSKLLK